MQEPIHDWLSFAADFLVFVVALIFAVGTVLALISSTIDAYGNLL